MKTWSEYFKFKEEASDIENDAPLNPSDMDEHGTLFRMTRLAWKNHQAQTSSFFKKLAAHDPEIAGEYQRLGNTDPLPSKKDDHDKDQICPPMADTGVGLQDD